MKFLSHFPKVSEKLQTLKIKIENYDDLWWLSNLVEEGDFIEKKDERRTKSDLGETKKSKRTNVFITISVEKLSFDGKILHIIGKITEASDEDIPLNSYHSFNVSINDVIVIKKIFDENAIEILKDVKKENNNKNLIIVIDEGVANIAILKDVKIEYYQISKNISGKQYESKREREKVEFYELVLNFIKNNFSKNIIIAGAGFEKENFYNYLKEKDKNIANNVIIENIGSYGINGIKEVISKSKKILEHINAVEDQRLIERFMYEISKDGLYSYTFNDVKNAMNCGAIEILLVTDKFFLENRKEVNEIIKSVRNRNGKIHILDSTNEAGMQLQNLGGIGAILRFKI